MRKRGRKSAAELETPTIYGIDVRRPAPPKELNKEQAETWKAVVGTRPADWFRPDTYPLLVSYCRHVWHASKIDERLARRFGPESNVDERIEIPELLKERERETRAILALARSMRITQQSQYRPEDAARKYKSEARPWDPAEG